MNDFFVFESRGPLIESWHEIAVAVVDDQNHLIARAGDPDLVTYWRSAAKPFQVMPVVEDGGIERFDLDQQQLALACGSHNAEPIHLQAGARWLAALGLPEEALMCGGHPSLWPSRAEEMLRRGVTPTPLWSNCSGKHAAFLGLALLNDWPIEGYQELGHPVQDRVAESVSRWSDVPLEKLRWGVDGCTAAAVALPLRAMALAYARLGVSSDPAAQVLRNAMMAEPSYLAGSERVETVLMSSWSGRVVVKTGAEGVFCVALPKLRLGIALKVHDGDSRAAILALVRVLDLLTSRLAPSGVWPLDQIVIWRDPPVRNTRGEITGRLGVQGELRFL